MAHGETYEEFVDKFKPKKTTDDCYTPPPVYDAIADWVANEYKLDRDCFVRPFYPGGDYERFDYGDAVVVDNPPFSIVTKIVDFYIKKRHPFFIFAPTLTLFSALKDRNCTALVVDYSIIYDNGAKVNTSFLTNLEPHDLRCRTAPTLYQAIKTAEKTSGKRQKKNYRNTHTRSQLLAQRTWVNTQNTGLSLESLARNLRMYQDLMRRYQAKRLFLAADICCQIG